MSLVLALTAGQALAGDPYWDSHDPGPDEPQAYPPAREDARGTWSRSVPADNGDRGSDAPAAGNERWRWAQDPEPDAPVPAYRPSPAYRTDPPPPSVYQPDNDGARPTYRPAPPPVEDEDYAPEPPRRPAPRVQGDGTKIPGWTAPIYDADEPSSRAGHRGQYQDYRAAPPAYPQSPAYSYDSPADLARREGCRKNRARLAQLQSELDNAQYELNWDKSTLKDARQVLTTLDQALVNKRKAKEVLQRFEKTGRRRIAANYHIAWDDAYNRDGKRFLKAIRDVQVQRVQHVEYVLAHKADTRKKLTSVNSERTRLKKAVASCR